MRAVISSIVISALVAFFTQQAGASPVAAEIIDGHLHLVARDTDAVDYSTHRRHHSRKHSKRASCNSRAVSSSSSINNTTSGSNAAAQKVSVKVSTGGTSSSSSNSNSNTGSSNSGSSSSSSGSSSSGSSSSASSSVSSFSGTNSNAILSWFRTNSGSDSTNGQSWCQTKYQDDWICFAPDVTTMLKEFGNDYNKAATAFCGREAIVTAPSGKSITAFICDGFDSKWVKTPASLDLTVGAFTQIYGSFDNNKNTVIQGATWKLTGNVVSKGTFKSSG